MTNTPGSDATATKTLVFIVDDHPIFRIGLKQTIESQTDMVVCGEAASSPQALDALRVISADVVLVDISLPGANGIELIKNIRAEHPKMAILVLSAHEESDYALRALRAGASGYLMKRHAADQLVPMLRKVLTGEIAVSPAFGEQLIFKAARGVGANVSTPLDALSDRELEVLAAVGAGDSSQEIARALNLSIKTIESHRLHIKEKLGLPTSSAMVRFAIDWRAHQSETEA